MRFPNHVHLVAVLAVVACGDIAVTPSGEEGLDNTQPNPTAPGAFLRFVATPELAGAVQVDSVLVTLLGPETRSLVLLPDGSLFEGRFDGLAPGTYSVASVGLANGEIVLLAHSANEVVSDGDSTDVSLTLVSYVPSMRPLENVSPSVSTSVEVSYPPVAYASSYLVETDTTENFETGSRFVTVDTNSTVFLNTPGTYYVRVRAQNDLVGTGAPSDARSIQIITDQTQSGDDANSAPVVAVESSQAATYDRLNILPAGDEDWFAVDLSAGEVLDVVVRSHSLIPSSTLNPRLALLGHADAIPAEAADSNDQPTDARQQKTATADGRYFVRVTGADRLSVGHYALEVSVERAESTTVQNDLIEGTHTSPVSGISDRRRSLIGNNDEWQGFWRQLWGSITPVPETPGINFDEKMVIVATMGERTTGGYSIAIEKVIEHEGKIVAYVVETSPGMGCSVLQALTSPATAVIVPRRVLEVTFENKTETRECH